MAELDKADLLLREQKESRVEIRESLREIADAMRANTDTLVKGFARLDNSRGGVPPAAAQNPWMTLIAMMGILGTFMVPLYQKANQTDDSVHIVASRVGGLSQKIADLEADTREDRADDEAKFKHIADIMNTNHENQERHIGVLWSTILPNSPMPTQDFWPLLEDR